MREDDVRRFNRWAADYDQSRLQRIFFGRVQHAVLDIVSGFRPEWLRLLDIGCGTGALLREAGSRSSSGDLYGVDPAPEMVRVAQESTTLAPRFHFLEAPAQSLPFPDGYFDVALSTVSFHHWGDQAQGLSEASRVIVPDGIFVLADIFAIGGLRPLFALGRNRDRFHTRAEIEALLNTAGLAVLGWKAVYRIGPFAALWAVFSRKSVR